MTKLARKARKASKAGRATLTQSKQVFVLTRSNTSFFGTIHSNAPLGKARVALVHVLEWNLVLGSFRRHCGKFLLVREQAVQLCGWSKATTWTKASNANICVVSEALTCSTRRRGNVVFFSGALVFHVACLLYSATIFSNVGRVSKVRDALCVRMHKKWSKSLMC